MSYLERLRKSREKQQVAYQEFVLHTRQNEDCLFCFFEGKDNAYYIPRVKNFTNKYHPIQCGGREKVLKVYELITRHREYDRYKKAFFIDCDFNQPLPSQNPPIFETPCYSIENLYVSVNVFKEIVKNEFSFSEVSDQEFQICLDLFLNRQKEFHQAVTLFNAWYACLIDIRNKYERRTGVNLKDKLPKNFVSFSLEKVSAQYDIETIKKIFANALEVEESILNKKIVEFKNCEHHKIFRGKYEMEFLLTIIELILQDSFEKKKRKYIKEKINFAFSAQLNNQQALSIFSSYAEIPESLNNYLEMVTK